MDRALWKAKKQETGEWITGHYIERLWNEWVTNDKGKMVQRCIGVVPQIHIGSNDLGAIECFLIDPSTLCQCTGLKDKNGQLIFEGDVVLGDISFPSSTGIGVYSDKFTVTWNGGTWMLINPKYEGLLERSLPNYFQQEIKVIGNIHD